MAKPPFNRDRAALAVAFSAAVILYVVFLFRIRFRNGDIDDRTMVVLLLWWSAPVLGSVLGVGLGGLVDRKRWGAILGFVVAVAIDVIALACLLIYLVART